MDGDQERRIDLGRQRVEQSSQRGEPAGRSPDDHEIARRHI
jgi:hypothetical protein